MDKETFSGIADMILELIHQAKHELAINGFDSDQDIILSMPSFLIDILPHAFYSIYQLYCNPITGTLDILEGLKIQPSPDLAITVFHKDYPLYQRDGMICKLPLDRIVKQYQHYEKILISLSNANCGKLQLTFLLYLFWDAMFLNSKIS